MYTCTHTHTLTHTHTQAFTQGKYAAYLLRHHPARTSEARALMFNALAAEPANIEGMIDFASLLSGFFSCI